MAILGKGGVRTHSRTHNHALGQKSSQADQDEFQPSRQLILNLEKAIQQLQTHSDEFKKVQAYNRRSFCNELDIVEHKRASVHAAALDAVTAHRFAVREAAESELRQYYLNLEEQERARKAEEERRERERLAKERAERERRERDEAARKATEARRQAEIAEAARKAAEVKAKAEAEKRERDAAAAREVEAREQAAKEAEAKKQAEAEAAKAEVQNSASPRNTVRSSMEPSSQAAPVHGLDNVVLHKKYLEIHQRLKNFRKSFLAHCKTNMELKKKIGDLRRSIKTSVGQLTDDKEGNRQATQRVRSSLMEATRIPDLQTDIRDFMVHPPPDWQSAEDCSVPGALVYLVNMFSKSVISQFSGEAGVSPKSAEPVGVLVASTFSTEAFCVREVSLIDILMSKFHFVCPVLWGIYGSEDTAEGRQKLGWRREQDQWVSANRHFERMTGLGAGYAAVALRNFAKAKMKNPYPPVNFWESFARIVNVPPQQVTTTHLTVLKSIIEHSSDRFIMFFDSAAIAALRLALIHFPMSLSEGSRKSPACKSLTLLVEIFRLDRNISLT